MARGAGARKRRTARRMQQATVRVSPHTDLPHALDDDNALEEIAAIFGDLAASGVTSLPLGPRTQSWDASAADKAVRTWADAADGPNAKYAKAFFVKGGDGSKFGDYKLGYAQPSNGTLTANWGGVTAVAGVLQGARGGANISPADAAAAKSKVEAYYAKARTQYKDDTIKVPWQADEAANETPAGLLAYAQLGGDADPALLAVAAAIWDEQFDLGAEEREMFASGGDCSNCGHAAGAHLGAAGPCTTEDCSCNGYDASEGGSKGNGDSTVEVREMQITRDSLDRIAEYADAGQLTVDEQGMIRMLIRQDGTITFPFALTEISLTDTYDDRVPGQDDDAIQSLPPQHKPGAKVPRRRPTPKAPVSPPSGAEVANRWNAILAPEGKLTSDGRAFAPGSIEWRDLPLTLMAMTTTSEGGHIGAQLAGRIDRIWRDEKAGVIRGEGVFDNGEYGQEIARLVKDGTLGGVSVDLAIHNYEVGPRSDWFDADGNWAPKSADEKSKSEPSILDLLFGGGEDKDDPTIAVVTSGEIGMTTVCPFPAFSEAKIAAGDSLVAGGNPAFWTVTSHAEFMTGVAEGAVTASLLNAVTGELLTDCDECGAEDEDGDALAASAADTPLAPPVDWFTDPEFTEPTAWTITDDGRVYGHAALWGVCHIGLPDRCTTAPASSTEYEFFHLGAVAVDGDTGTDAQIACGTITFDTGHPDLHLNGQATIAHYDDTGTVAAHVRAGEDEHGIWVAGALAPGLTDEQIRVLRGAKLSGDWRKMPGVGHELVGLLCVNVPGFPVPRSRAAVTAGGEPEVLALVAAGIPLGESDLSPDELEQFRALGAAVELERLSRG